ncbi:hypothetical protein BaRGS_00009444, partial [Batillaria attramentaria]
MWVLVAQCVVVLLVGNCVFADESVPNCEGSPSEVWRNEGGPEECAEKAVCGDKWTMIRDWHNGTRCRDTRIVYNCQCPHAHDAPCPVNDDDYALHASRIHNQYLCQRACSLDKCSSNVRAAQEMVYHFRDNDPRRNYYRANKLPLSSARQYTLYKSTRWVWSHYYFQRLVLELQRRLALSSVWLFSA